MTKIYFGTLSRDPDTEAEHFGVKGMKWGVIRENPSGSDSSSKGNDDKKSSGSYDRNKPMVFDNGDGSIAFVGGAGGEGSEEYEEYLKAMRAIMEDKSLSLDEILAKSAQLKADFKSKLTKKYGLEGENLGKNADGTERDSKEKKGSFLDGVFGSINKTIDDSKKNIGNFLGDAEKTVNRAIRDFKRDVFSSTQTTTSQSSATYKGKTSTNEEVRTVKRNGLGQIVSDTSVVSINGKKSTVDNTMERYKRQQEARHSEDSRSDFITGAIPPSIDGENIEHFGVPGMRWGFRKATTRGGTPPSKRKAKPDKGEEKEAPKKKTVKDLSDSELNERIRRLQAEKQYAQLTAPEKSKNVVADILANSGKQIASQVITQVGTAYLKKAIGVQLDKRLPAAYAVGKVLNEVKKD